MTSKKYLEIRTMETVLLIQGRHCALGITPNSETYNLKCKKSGIKSKKSPIDGMPIRPGEGIS
ncbi:hypothetical protein TorRG33x02_069860 [Trema orientale]|uniref:Uncharacterized protein n=1 Tax=Trema orientale TaxID=63057 RepID=A0A2P5FHF3_TREOI|nr:hypothetical protein TorRG33x02_069860 [Trema orientale]